MAWVAGGAGSKVTLTLRAILGPELPRSSTSASPCPSSPRMSTHNIGCAAYLAGCFCCLINSRDALTDRLAKIREEPATIRDKVDATTQYST